MRKVIFFDIDDTLAVRGIGITDDVIKEVNELSKKHDVVLITGNTAEYVFGMVRQIDGFNNVSIICENGATIYGNPIFPTTNIYRYEKQDSDKESLTVMSRSIFSEFNGEVFKVFNCEASLTLVFKDMEIMTKVHKKLLGWNNEDYIIYKHTKSIDILYKGVDKGAGVLKYLEVKNYNRETTEIHIFGNGINDISMFKIGDDINIVGDMEYEGIHTRVGDVSNMAKYIKDKYKR